MKHNKPETVVIIIPTYNERENIQKLLPILTRKIFPQLKPNFSPHILVVDDNSPDDTGKVVMEFGKKDKRVHLLTNKKKAGLGNAYTKGMQHALTKLNADIVFEFDADFSHDPKKIKPMLDKLSQGNHMVLGSRYIKGGSIPQNWAFHRKFLSVVGNLIIRIIVTHRKPKDWTTGYRAIRKKVIQQVLPQLKGDRFSGYAFQIGFLHKTVGSGFKVGEVPIKFIDRTEGKSKLGPEYIKNTLLYILKVRWQELPRRRLAKFAIVGIIGATFQLTTLQLFRQFFPYQLSYFFSVEIAVISNFIFSNAWTFSDRSLLFTQIPVKFFQFNLTSAGSIIIQQLLAFFGETYIGLYKLFYLPVFNLPIDTGVMFAVVGISIGMCWNFIAYSKIIWRRLPLEP